jgi:hypothetical protein
MFTRRSLVRGPLGLFAAPAGGVPAAAVPPPPAPVPSGAAAGDTVLVFSCDLPGAVRIHPGSGLICRVASGVGGEGQRRPPCGWRPRPGKASEGCGVCWGAASPAARGGSRGSAGLPRGHMGARLPFWAGARLTTTRVSRRQGETVRCRATRRPRRGRAGLVVPCGRSGPGEDDRGPVASGKVGDGGRWPAHHGRATTPADDMARGEEPGRVADRLAGAASARKPVRGLRGAPAGAGPHPAVPLAGFALAAPPGWPAGRPTGAANG